MIIGSEEVFNDKDNKSLIKICSGWKWTVNWRIINTLDPIFINLLGKVIKLDFILIFRFKICVILMKVHFYKLLVRFLIEERLFKSVEFNFIILLQ
jgi:hypothetical protein